MILALDISTSCTGYALFDENDLVDIGYINLSKHKGLFEKATYIKDRILRMSHDYHVTEVVVEENLQAFRPGLSSAKTLMTLAQFNGVVRWICYDIFDIEPVAINVNSARKRIGLKIDRKNKEKNTKQQVLEWVASNNLDIKWPTKILKSGPNKGQERLIDGAYDMADAYVIGKAYLIENL